MILIFLSKRSWSYPSMYGTIHNCSQILDHTQHFTVRMKTAQMHNHLPYKICFANCDAPSPPVRWSCMDGPLPRNFGMALPEQPNKMILPGNAILTVKFGCTPDKFGECQIVHFTSLTGHFQEDEAEGRRHRARQAGVGGRHRGRIKLYLRMC